VPRPRSSREIPPPLELECLRALWTLGEANVQAVRSHLEPNRTLAYTTVMTMLDRLSRKHAVTRRKVGRSFLYTPVLSREQVQRLAVKELLDTLFDGSSASLISYLNGRPHTHESPNGAPATAPIDDSLL
jgi:predicted transcriptional regulator